MTPERVLDAIDRLVWGPPLMLLLVGTGLYLTVRVGGVQLRGFRHAVDVLRGKYDDPDDPGEIPHFRALAAALSATIGTGNVIGVAAAILAGGPGAVFWMWITALVGMATKFTSCTLAVRFRRVDERGEAHAGPMHYIELGMGPRFRWLAVAFAVFTALASFGIGNMFQIRNVVVSTHTLLRGAEAGTPPFAYTLAVGVGVAVVVGMVILGGIRSIARVAALVVPFMCLLYVGTGLWILAGHLGAIPGAFREILHGAFHAPEAVGGGLLGTVIRAGVSRGLFSNEAGMGSAPMIHGAAKTDEPVREGLVAMLGPFVDTLVVCSMTALVIVATGAAGVSSDTGELTAVAFSRGLGSGVGADIVAQSVTLFAVAPRISWSYYGDRAVDYLFGRASVRWYRLVYCGVIVLGAVTTLDTVIEFSDVANALMALPNLVALLALSPVVAAATSDYFARMREERQTARAYARQPDSEDDSYADPEAWQP
jgi:AGCS family alanine or glycine:cation symporter